MKGQRFLVISDLQIPFEARHALPFAKAVQKEFGIDKDSVLNVGDELDQYWASRYDKDPNVPITATEEIKRAKEHLKEWYAAFPKMKIATSNHGMRWLQKATAAGIPSDLLRTYKEVLEAPDGWEWRDVWRIRGLKQNFDMIHGLGYSSMYSFRQIPLDRGISTVFGHLHSNAGIAIIENRNGQRLWGMNSGCLVDPEAFAFAYGKWSRFAPCLGVGVVIDDGMTPIWLPYERFAS